MIENWLLAVIALFAGLVVLVVLLPVYNLLMPSINSSMGSSVSMMAGTMIVLIVVGLFYQFVISSRQDSYGGQG